MVIFEVTSVWRFHDDTEVKINACSIFTITDEKFTDQRIYVDNAPSTATSQEAAPDTRRHQLPASSSRLCPGARRRAITLLDGVRHAPPSLAEEVLADRGAGATDDGLHDRDHRDDRTWPAQRARCGSTRHVTATTQLTGATQTTWKTTGTGPPFGTPTPQQPATMDRVTGRAVETLDQLGSVGAFSDHVARRWGLQ